MQMLKDWIMKDYQLKITAMGSRSHSNSLFISLSQYQESLSDDALLQDDDEEEDDNESRSWRR